MAGRTVLVLTMWVATLMTAGAERAQALAPQSVPGVPAEHRAALGTYCVTCHNERLKTGGLVLEALDLAQVSGDAAVWEKVVTKLRTGTMPPAGAPRPDAATFQTLATWLEGELDRAARAHPNPGATPALHRLNRVEYQNAVRDVLAIDHLPRELDVDVLLPADDSSFGFDNIADALHMSPVLIERYLSAAQKISRLAVGDPAMPLIVDTYKVPSQLPQADRFEGMPFGTRGGLSLRRFFPLDGEYVFRLVIGGRSEDVDRLELAIDGLPVQHFEIDGRGRGRAPDVGTVVAGYAVPSELAFQVRVPVAAGPRLVTATFVKKTAALTEDLLRPFSRSGQAGAPAQPVLDSLTISGPYSPGGAGDTPSRRRIFVCRPSSAADEPRCAREILVALARRAYRRPVTDDDLQVLMPFFESGRLAGGFESGIRQALERMLVSPAFLFRIEPTVSHAVESVPRPGSAAVPALRRISDTELASRLSFFLWSSVPDDELLDLAARGRLREAPTLEAQVRRMLRDPKATALAANFGGQWLFLRNLEAASPDPRLFPDFDEALRRSMRRETELFFEHIVSENRSVLEFLTADYTFVNERLARHYGIRHVYGDRFRRVSLAGQQRRGMLGHGSLLTVTSYAHRTSPVLRGKWMLENILGAPPPPPPPDVPALPETDLTTGKPLSMREAMVTHRRNPACASCHSRMDPIGFAMEQFDAVGRWRTEGGANEPIDTSGVMPDGTTFDGTNGLVEALMRHPVQVVRTMTERLLTYALGRGLEYFDAPAVRAITREAAADDYRFAAVILGIVGSTPFQMRAAAPSAAASAGSAP